MITTLLVLLITIMASKLGAAAALSSSQQCKPAALIFLHGLGDTPAGWSSLQQALPQLRPNLKHLKYVFPPAPITKITINGGMAMPGWFDLYDWPIGVGSQDDQEGIQASVKQIQEQVTKLEQEGIPKSRIVLGGFSQGGAISLLTAYQPTEEPFAACVLLSAWLTLPDQLNIKDPANKTPLFWGHGQYDDKVLFEQQAFGVEKLRAQGVDVTAADFPMGHSSDPEEIQAMADFLDRVLYGDE